MPFFSPRLWHQRQIFFSSEDYYLHFSLPSKSSEQHQRVFGVSLYYYTRVSDGHLRVQLIWDLSFTFDVQFLCCNNWRETTGGQDKVPRARRGLWTRPGASGYNGVWAGIARWRGARSVNQKSRSGAEPCSKCTRAFEVRRQAIDVQNWRWLTDSLSYLRDALFGLVWPMIYIFPIKADRSSDCISSTNHDHPFLRSFSFPFSYSSPTTVLYPPSNLGVYVPP